MLPSVEAEAPAPKRLRCFLQREPEALRAVLHILLRVPAGTDR
jgi:hypothetical protein